MYINTPVDCHTIGQNIAAEGQLFAEALNGFSAYHEGDQPLPFWLKEAAEELGADGIEYLLELARGLKTASESGGDAS